MVAQNKVFTTRLDSAGRMHAAQEVRTVYLNQLSPEDQALIDKAARVNNVRPKDVTNHVVVSAETKGTFSAPVDTAGKFTTSDGHLTLTGKADSGKIEGNYTYKDDAFITGYRRPFKLLGIRMGIFGGKDYIDVSFGNDKTQIVGLTNIDLKKYSPPKRFGVGFQAGYTYMDGRFRPYIGAGLSYNLVRF